MADELLFQAVAQTVDALTFTQTHVIDEDFRAHSKSTIDSVRSLQQEQRDRMDYTYGARAASSDFIAGQLMAVYRGEMGLMSIARESMGTDTAAVPHAFTSQTRCHAFKREMKQRIHEWERAFSDEHGVAVTPRDKMALRPVYELYKASKNHLRDSEARSEVTVANYNEINAPTRSTSPGVRRSGGEDGIPALSSQKHTIPGANTTATPAITASGNSINSMSVGLTTISTGAAAAAAGATSLSTGNVNMSMPSSIQAPMPVSPAAVIGDLPANQMSSESLVAEKRYLKRVLHHFETEFERQNGNVPTREDRRALAREYSRYGELKNEIQRRQNSNAGSTAPDAI